MSPGAHVDGRHAYTGGERPTHPVRGQPQRAQGVECHRAGRQARHQLKAPRCSSTSRRWRWRWVGWGRSVQAAAGTLHAASHSASVWQACPRTCGSVGNEQLLGGAADGHNQPCRTDRHVRAAVGGQLPLARRLRSGGVVLQQRGASLVNEEESAAAHGDGQGEGLGHAGQRLPGLAAVFDEDVTAQRRQA